MDAKRPVRFSNSVNEISTSSSSSSSSSPQMPSTLRSNSILSMIYPAESSFRRRYTAPTSANVSPYSATTGLVTGLARAERVREGMRIPAAAVKKSRVDLLVCFLFLVDDGDEGVEVEVEVELEVEFEKEDEYRGREVHDVKSSEGEEAVRKSGCNGPVSKGVPLTERLSRDRRRRERSREGPGMQRRDDDQWS